MQIKLIALDLDGTLLNRDKQISERNRCALQRAADQGIWIVPSTGRFYKGMPAVVRELPFVRYTICVNGAEVYDAAEQRTLYRAEIPPLAADRLFAYMDGLPVIYDCYQDGWGWMDKTHYARMEEFLDDQFALDMVRNLRTPVEHFRRAMRERNRPIQKAQMFFRQSDLARRAEELERMPEQFPELAITSAAGNNIEINSREAGKGRALQELCAFLGIRPEASMAFGDGLNDLSMLRDAGVGVAMGNAAAQIRDAADLVAPDNQADGVADVLERLVLRPQPCRGAGAE